MKKIKIKTILPMLISVCFLIISIILYKNNFSLNSINIKNNESVQTSAIKCHIQHENDMTAIWVPFMSLDMKNSDFSENSFKQKFQNIINTSKKHNINTLIVHVHSHADAMYPSSYFPFSHLLTGAQGKDPGFDPLEYMIDETHKNNMSFHAWFNPLRIQKNGVPKELAKSNYYIKWQNNETAQNENFTLDWNNDKYFNPACSQVRSLIINDIKEVVSKYNVDGVHFDDYFYPTQDPSYDKLSYTKYCNDISNPLPLNEWRMTNINSLISGVYSAIKSIDNNVLFGISPQCNIKNDINMGADVYSWGSTPGYVDYLCPQVYVNFEHPFLPFDLSAKQWRDLVSCNKVKLYYGLGIYKAGSEADNGSWKSSNDIIMRQIEYCKKLNCNGFMIYSYDYLDNPQTKAEITNAMKVLH